MTPPPIINSRRNRIAVALANACLRLADPHFRKVIAGIYLYGLDGAVRDVKEGREAPPPWREAVKS